MQLAILADEADLQQYIIPYAKDGDYGDYELSAFLNWMFQSDLGATAYFHRGEGGRFVVEVGFSKRQCSIPDWMHNALATAATLDDYLLQTADPAVICTLMALAVRRDLHKEELAELAAMFYRTGGMDSARYREIIAWQERWQTVYQWYADRHPLEAAVYAGHVKRQEREALEAEELEVVTVPDDDDD